MLVRITIAAALLGASPALAAAPTDRLSDSARCILTHQQMPHGKGVTTPIVKCDARSADLARTEAVRSTPAEKAVIERN